MMNEADFFRTTEQVLEEITHRLLDNEPVKAYTLVMEVRNSIVARREELAACPPK